MILIADSGSSKTDWCFAISHKEYVIIKTEGINPIVQSQDYISNILFKQFMPQVQQKGLDVTSLESIRFYGAGCTPEKSDVVANLLRNCVMRRNTDIYVASDLLAAAHALCGHNEGIACILGTGSNSCLYDGNKIIAHTPALGFILGDEGSGSALGKSILNGILKGWLPKDLGNVILKETGLTQASIIENVYRKKNPNRFLASLSKHILPHIDVPEISEIVIRNFEQFIKVNLHPYKSTKPVLNSVGSIAHYYKPQLCEASARQGYSVGKVIKSPMEGLINFYFTEDK